MKLRFSFLAAAVVFASVVGAAESRVALNKGGIRIDPFKISSAVYTVEAWVKPDSVDVENIVFDQFFGNGQEGDWRVGLNGGYFGVFTRGMYSGNWGKLATKARTDCWTHLAVSCDGSAARIYVNGRFAQEFTAVKKIAPTSRADFYVGGKVGAPFVGKLSECRVWSTVRSEAEISDNLWNRLQGDEAGLLAYWPLDEGMGTEVVDRVSAVRSEVSSDATWEQMTVPCAPVPGESAVVARPYAAQDPGDGVITFDGGLKIRKATYTLEAWVRPTNDSRPEMDIVRQFKGNTRGDLILRVDGLTLKVLCRYFANGNVMPARKKLSLWRWSHVAVTSDGETMKLYVDGVLDSTYDRETTGDFTPPQDVSLVLCGGVDSQYLDADVSEIRVWECVRSAAEITAGMKTRLSGTEDGLLVYLPFAEDTGNVARNYAKWTYTSLADADGTVGGAAHWVEAVNPMSPRTTAVSPFQVWSEACLDTNMRIDASQFSLEAWVRPYDVSKEHVILSQYAGGGQNNDLILTVDSNGRLRTFFRYFNGLSNFVYSPNNVFTVGKWAHVAASCDGDTIVSYVNGVKVSELARTASGKITPTQNQNLMLGGFDNQPAKAIIGYLSEVRVWSFARTQAEFVATMNTRATGWEPGLVGLWPLNQLSGESAENFCRYGVSGATMNCGSGGWKKVGHSAFGDVMGMLLMLR